MLKRGVNYLLILLSLTLASCNTQASVITLATDGKSEYVVVLPIKPDKKEIKAAAIFIDYFKRVTGVTLSVLSENKVITKGIFIGKTDRSKQFDNEKVRDDGFAIYSDTSGVYIRGGSGQGIIYGTYGFIEQYLGCHKYDTGPASFKKTTKVTLPQALAEIQNPSFIYREAYYPQSADAEYLQWHHLQQFADLWGLWGHSFFKVISPDVYFKPHPEYFAEVNGKRQPTQLCLSNPEVLKLFTTYLQKQIDLKPDAVYWSIAQNDGGGYCTCKYCKAVDDAEGGPQGSISKFVNAIAMKFPEQQFTTLAYGYSSKPPLHIVPAKNVTVMLSSINVSREQPVKASPSAADFRSDLKGWNAVTDRLFIWDYTTQFTNYLAPFPDYNNLGENLNYLKANQVSGIFSQGSGETYSDLAELNSYILAKGLWNSAIDTKAVIAEFLKGYYGDAAPYLQNYIDTIQNNVTSSNTKLDIYGNPVNNIAGYLSPAYLKNYTAFFKEALNAVKDNELLTNRVLKARLPLQFTILQQSKVDEKGVLSYMAIFYEDIHTKDDLLKNIEVFSRNCKIAGVTELSENGIAPDKYLEQWAAFLSSIDSEINIAKNTKVTLKYPYSADYPASKEKTLTDGLFGTLDYSFNWLFLYGNDLDATIDLGSEKDFSTVKTNFLIDPKHHIFAPQDLKILISLDGVTYKPFGKPAVSKEINDEKAFIRHIIITGVAKARYIRIIAKEISIADAGLMTANKKPALCCDEVVVN